MVCFHWKSVILVLRFVAYIAELTPAISTRLRKNIVDTRGRTERIVGIYIPNGRVSNDKHFQVYVKKSCHVLHPGHQRQSLQCDVRISQWRRELLDMVGGG